jgi:hypothetical protein
MKEVKNVQFKLKKGKGSVNRFVAADGTTYKPGDIVDLPPSFRGEKWLEVVNKKIVKPMVPVSPKVEEPKHETTVSDAVPLPEKTEKKSKKPAKKK